jgi:hypothetical protein
MIRPTGNGCIWAMDTLARSSRVSQAPPRRRVRRQIGLPAVGCHGQDINNAAWVAASTKFLTRRCAVWNWRRALVSKCRSQSSRLVSSCVRRSGRAAEFGSRKPHGYLDSQHEQACCRSTGSRSGGGVAVFLGNEKKVFVIYIDQSVGVAIAMFMQGTQRERPLTYDDKRCYVRPGELSVNVKKSSLPEPTKGSDTKLSRGQVA